MLVHGWGPARDLGVAKVFMSFRDHAPRCTKAPIAHPQIPCALIGPRNALNEATTWSHLLGRGDKTRSIRCQLLHVLVERVGMILVHIHRDQVSEW
jgi:hypothetical protein